MKRYHITLGASTTAQGKVVSASAPMSIMGARQALEGDEVFCPACKSTGKIVCVEPRLKDAFNGRQRALSDDLCLCACSTPPRLVASQSMSFQTIDSVVEVGAAAHGSGQRNGVLDEAFRAVDANGDAVVGQPYCIRTAEGQEVRGRTDERGLTHRIVTAQPAALELFWEEAGPDFMPDDDEEGRAC